MEPVEHENAQRLGRHGKKRFLLSQCVYMCARKPGDVEKRSKRRRKE